MLKPKPYLNIDSTLKTQPLSNVEVMTNLQR